MKTFGTSEGEARHDRLADSGVSEALYAELRGGKYSDYPFHTRHLGEGMAVVEEVVFGYWKPRYLLDNKAGRAFEFMDDGERLATVGLDDIEWGTLEGLPGEVLERARRLSAHFPTMVGRFEHGVAEVSWTLNPDGMYYMDDDGYGMTDDEEVKVYGYIDRSGRVSAKFRRINDYSELKAMRAEAEAKAAR